MITLDTLLADKSAADWRADLYGGCQGRGFVFNPDGLGTGSLTLAGTPLGNYDVLVKVVSISSMTMQFQWSIDDGSNWTSATTDANGAFAFTTLGVAMQLAPEGDVPYVPGDVYGFQLRTPALQATAWQEGSVGRTLLDVDATVLEVESAVVKAITEGGFLEYATGGWLDLLAENVYDLTRVQAQITIGNITLQDTLGVGPFAVQPGQLTVQSSAGKQYTNVAAFTIPQSPVSVGGTPTTFNVTALFQAVEPGKSYDVVGGDITRLVTTLPGVVVGNPDPGGGSWIAQQGLDVESDTAFRARCAARWPSIGVGGTADAYFTYATTASTSVNRVLAQPDGTTPGQVDIYLAGPGGAVSNTGSGAENVVATVNAYIQPRVPLCVTAIVASATPVTLTITGTVNVLSGNGTAAMAQISANLTAYAIGGTNNLGQVLPGVPIGGTAYLSDIIEQIQASQWVRNVPISSLLFNGIAAADFVLTVPQVLSIVNSLTPVNV